MKKKPFSTFVKGIALAAIICAGSQALQAQLLGDVNSSGTVDIVDALLVSQYYVGLSPDNFNIANADVNCNGVDIIDALLIARYYVGLIQEFTCIAQPTTGPNQYVLHIDCKGDTLEPGLLKASIRSSSGDYTTAYTQTPFDIGPYPEPFTVTLNANFTAYYGGTFIFANHWKLDGVNVSSATVTVTVDAAHPERTVIAEYYDDMAHMTPIPTNTPVVTPDALPTATPSDAPTSLPTQCPCAARVSGYVRDAQTGEPIPGAIVTITEDYPSTITLTTDSTGFYTVYLAVGCSINITIAVTVPEPSGTATPSSGSGGGYEDGFDTYTGGCSSPVTIDFNLEPR